MIGRRRFLGSASALAGAALLAPGALPAAAADTRFGLGIASGQPHATGMVLWTRLTGEGLADRVEVQWEVADDERFGRVVAHGSETAEAEWAHSVHAEPVGLTPGRWYWYRFRALGEASPAGRTRTAPAADAAATLRFALASCQRYDTGRYAAWQHVAESDLDVVMFVGDYIYEYASKRDALRRHEGGNAHTLAEYRARYATYKADPQLQAAHAAMPWLFVWDDHEVSNDYASFRDQYLEPNFPDRRAAAYRAYWEHTPFPKSARPVGPDMRIVSRLDWGRLARLHLVDDRQYRDVQVCPKPGRGGSNTVSVAECPSLLDPARTLLGAEQERWLAEGWDLGRPWNLLVQQTLMARNTWKDPAQGGGTYWTDGWDGYPLARQRLLDVVGAKKVPGVVVLGGDVHANYVASLKADFDDPTSATVASEFCGTSISSPGQAQSLLDAARPFNPHIAYSRADQRGVMSFELTAGRMLARLQVVDRPREAESGVRTAASFAVDARQPGPVSA